MIKRLIPVTCLVVLAASVAGCAYEGSGIGNPIARKFQWFSFVEGSDLRQSCSAQSDDRFRIIYNGNYEEQVRIYEIKTYPGDRLTVAQRIIGTPDLARLTLSDPLAPGRGDTAERVLNQSQTEKLLKSFAASGLYTPPPVGLDLRSEEHFWTAAFCKDGQYGFTAWEYPSARYDDLVLDDALLAVDSTDVPYNPPRRFIPNALRDNEVKEGGAISFRLEVTEQGLLGGSIF